MKILKFDIKELNRLLKIHKTVEKLATHAVNINDGKKGISRQSLSRWLKTNGYYVDTETRIKKFRKIGGEYEWK